MTYTVFFCGIVVALIMVMVFFVIWLWVRTALSSWSYELTRETNNLLRDAKLKLDLMQHNQERLLSRLDRLDQTADIQNRQLKDLGSRFSQPKSAM